MALDYAVHAKLRDLVDKATSRQNTSGLDLGLVDQIKRICKASDNNVTLAFEFIYSRLRQPHSQVRLLALELLDVLFTRSRLFRALVATKFSNILELVVGFRSDHPLPPPATTATHLRCKALELIKKWYSEHGSTYQQISFGFRYLSETLRFEFPEIDTRQQAAAAAQAEREARARQIAAEKLRKLMTEWPQHASEHASLLQEVNEAFDLLDEEERRQNPAANEAEDEDLGWEDVPHDTAAAQRHNDDGLSKYAPAERDAGIGPVPQPSAPRDDNHEENDALLETIEGLYKLINSRALPSLQETLQTLVRADINLEGNSSISHARRESILRSATEYRQKMMLAKARFEAARLDLKCLVVAQQRRLQKEREKLIMEQIFGSESEDEVVKKQGDSSTKRRKISDIESHVSYHRNRRASNETAGNTQRTGDADEEDVLVNPYDTIIDPTVRPSMPQKKPMVFAKDLATKIHHRPDVEGSKTSTEARRLSTKSSSLPTELRKSLLDQAPVLPAGAYQHVWESDKAAPQFVNVHALEVGNHWGPVDIQQELPNERLEEMFLIPVVDSSLRVPSGAARPQKSNTSHIQRRQPPVQTSAGREPQRDPATVPPVPLGSIPGADPSYRRAQRAAERAYNDLVLVGMTTDEQFAAALAESQEPRGESTDNGRKKRRQKVQNPVRQRLASRLLKGGAVSAAKADLAAADQERVSEKFVNNWENK